MEIEAKLGEKEQKKEIIIKEEVNIAEETKILIDFSHYFIGNKLKFANKKYPNDLESSDFLIQKLLLINKIKPELIFQLIIYFRQNVKSIELSNLLISFCSISTNTKPFFLKYVSKIDLLPLDLIKISQFIQILRHLKIFEEKNQKICFSEIENLNVRKQMKLPKCFRILVSKKFKKFSDLILNEQCSEIKRKRQILNYLSIIDSEKFHKKIEDKKTKKNLDKKSKKITKSKNSKISKTIYERDFMNMKDLIKLSHIKSPQYIIRCILGRKYPATEDSFKTIFEKDIEKFQIKFEQGKANKRMVLKVSKEEIEKGLIEKTKNGFFYENVLKEIKASLKSILFENQHEILIEKIFDKESIKNSGINPFKIFKSLFEMNDLKKNSEIKVKKGSENEMKSEEQKTNEIYINEQNLNLLLNKYEKSLNLAIDLAVDENLERIEGNSLILIDVSISMIFQDRFKDLFDDNNRNGLEIALLIGQLLFKKCNKSSFYIFSSPKESDKDSKSFINVDSICSNGNNYLMKIDEIIEKSKTLGGGDDFPFEIIHDLIKNNQKIDNFFIISDMIISKGYNEIGTAELNTTNIFEDYLNKINQNAKFFSFNLKGNSISFSHIDDIKEKSFFRIHSIHNDIFRFISLKQKDSLDEVNKLKF